jgi:HSP20 family protein
MKSSHVTGDPEMTRKPKLEDSRRREPPVEEGITGRDDDRRQAIDDLGPESEAESGEEPYPNEVRFAHELDRAFEGFANPSNPDCGRPFRPGRESVANGGGLLIDAWAPAIEVFQNGERLVIRAELPGLAKDDLHVEIANDKILIEGERREEHEQQEDDFFHSERSYGSFFRTIALPEGARADKAEATFRNGILEITLPAPARGQQKNPGGRLELKG